LVLLDVVVFKQLLIFGKFSKDLIVLKNREVFVDFLRVSEFDEFQVFANDLGRLLMGDGWWYRAFQD
tara:strand:+ start:344 stop:544 length:201 start_codon:yes stop_codon:yes gene_type:complete